MNGKGVHGVTQLRNLIAMEAPGTRIDMTVFRNGKEKHVTMPLGTQPRNLLASDTHNVSPWADNNSADSLGMTLGAPGQEMADKFNLPSDTRGTVITSIKSGSAARRRPPTRRRHHSGRP